MMLIIKNLAFTLVAPGTVGVAVPWLLAADGPLASGALGIAAMLLLTLGACIYAWCVWDFASFGRGTPAPIDAPKMLVVRGLYRYTRNPMYLGVLTVIAGWALLFRSGRIAIYACAIAIVFHSFVRLYEEPHLQREFGAEYADYLSRVARWLPHRPPQ